MFKFYKTLFLITLISGTLMAISAYSWMSMWMGLEINLLSMIPLLKSNKNMYPSESALKYFITQAMASTILLFSIITSMNLNEFIPQNSNLWTMMILNSALLTKMGAAPFHVWFPEVMEGLNWTNCFIMLTWQKIAPMVLLMYQQKMILFLSFIIIFSSIIGGVIGLNQISLRKIMAYSSINHIAWMLASMLNTQPIWFIYFIIYAIITTNIILIFKYFNIFYLKQLFNNLNYNKPLKFFFILNFMSLGGLPPFLGFLPKWLTINSLVNSNFLLLSLLLIVFTLMTLFFYLRITFLTLMINYNETLIYKNMKMSYSMVLFNFISLCGMAACILIFNFY